MNRRRLWCLFFALVGSLLWGGAVWGAAPGSLLWETNFNFLPQYDTILSNAMAVSSTTLIVCGSAQQFDISNNSTVSLGFIKAFDTATGQLQWEGTPLTMASTPNSTNDNEFISVTVIGNTAVVQGYAASYTFNPNPPYGDIFTLNKTIVRAYNATTGQLLWEVLTDSYPQTQGSSSVALANNRFFLAETQNNPIAGTTGNCVVQAYQVTNANLGALPLLLE